MKSNKENSLMENVSIIIVATILTIIYNLFVNAMGALQIISIVFVEVVLFFTISFFTYKLIFRKNNTYFMFIVPLIYALILSLLTLITVGNNILLIVTIFVVRYLSIFLAILISKYWIMPNLK